MWFRRTVDGLLVIGLVVSGGWAYRLEAERGQLQVTYDRLIATTGELDVGNPALLTLRAIPNPAPLQAAWRVYIPAGPIKVTSKLGIGLSRSSPFPFPAEETFFRVACRTQRDEIRVCGDFGGGSSTRTLGDRSLMDFLRGRWDQVIVEQAGATEILATDPKRSFTLLKWTIPPALVEEAKARLSPQCQHLIPTLLEVKVN